EQKDDYEYRGRDQMPQASRVMGKAKKLDNEKNKNDRLQHPKRALGEGVAGTLAKDDTQVESALHDNRVSKREREEGKQHCNGEKRQGRRGLDRCLVRKSRSDKQDKHRAQA